MAKKAMIEREKKRSRLVKKYAAKRLALKKVADNKDLPMEERFTARLKLAGLPRNSSATRYITDVKLLEGHMRIIVN